MFLKPAKLETALDAHIENISNKLDHFDKRLDHIDADLNGLMEKVRREEDIELALLHDAIVQIYHFSKSQGKVFVEDYQRACELYKYNGKSQYIETIMEELEELYKQSVKSTRSDDK